GRGVGVRVRLLAKSRALIRPFGAPSPAGGRRAVKAPLLQGGRAVTRPPPAGGEGLSQGLLLQRAKGCLLPQPRPQGGEVAWPGARVELRADDLFPGRAAGGRRAGQAEHEGAVGKAGEGTRLQRRGTDLVEADRAEDLAEPRHLLVQQRQQRLGGGVAAG